MDQERYSTYDAKARFSEILRKVRSGRSVTITWHGEPVAEIRPVDSRSGVQARIERLAERGLVTPRTGRGSFQPVAHRPGALERFLEERDEA